MSARDFYHNTVRNSLSNDGWQITHDPLEFRVGVFLRIDLGAEKLISAEKGTEKIAVEVKSFVSDSAISEYHRALGQYINYRRALRVEDPDRVLYLAIPENVYNTFFSIEFIRSGVEELEINLLVYNSDREEIIKWQN